MKRRDECYDDWIKLVKKLIKKKKRALDYIIDSIESYEDDPDSISVITPIFYETSLTDSQLFFTRLFFIIKKHYYFSYEFLF